MRKLALLLGLLALSSACHAQTVRISRTIPVPPQGACTVTIDYGPTTAYGTNVTMNHSAASYYYDITSQTIGATVHYRVNICGNTGADESVAVGTDCAGQHWVGPGGVGVIDTYGGAVMSCPSGHATGLFHTEVLTLNGATRWWLVDPLGNPYWGRGVQAFAGVGLGTFYGGGSFPSNKYANSQAWYDAENQRMLAWGFNNWDSYVSTVTALPIGIFGSLDGSQYKVPFALTSTPANDATQGTTFCGNTAKVTSLFVGLNTNYISFSGAVLPDIYNPNFTRCATGELAYFNNSYTLGPAFDPGQATLFTSSTGNTWRGCTDPAHQGSWNINGRCDFPWLTYIIMDEPDNLYTYKGRGDNPLGGYPFTAAVVAASQFNFTAVAGCTINCTNYSKQAWINYLIAQHGTVAALNTAWGTSGFYTSFNDTPNALHPNDSMGTGNGSTTVFSETAAAPLQTGTVTVSNFINPPQPFQAWGVSVATTGGSIGANVTISIQSEYITGGGGITTPSGCFSFTTPNDGLSTHAVTVQSVPSIPGQSVNWFLFAITGSSCTGSQEQGGSSEPTGTAITMTSVATGTSSVNATNTTGGTISVTDNGSGSISGTGVSSGSVNYSTGAVSVTFSAAVTSGFPVIVSYNGNGFGVGTGVIDEDGRHAAWMGTDPCMLNGTRNNGSNPATTLAPPSGVVTDLQGFECQFWLYYFKSLISGIRQVDQYHLITTPDPTNHYGYATWSYILQAMHDAGADLMYTDYDPGCASNTAPFTSLDCPRTTSGTSGIVTAYNTSGLPTLGYDLLTAQQDSSEYKTTGNVSIGTGNGSATSFSGTVRTGTVNGNVGNPLLPNTVTFTDGTHMCTDNGSGGFTGSGCNTASSSVTYSTGAITCAFTAAPASGASITAAATGMIVPYYAPPDTGATQATRGTQYQSDVTGYLNAKGGDNKYFIVGISLWRFQDPIGGEVSNEGLTTQMDNAYDGSEDTTAAVSCSAPISSDSCGHELHNMGNFIGPVTTANKGIYATLLGTPH